MTDTHDDRDLTPTERQVLADLRQPEPPPAALVDRVVTALRRRRLIDPAATGWFQRLLPVVAAAAAALALGVWIGRSAPIATPAAPAPEFMLLLYEDAGFRAPRAGGAPARAQEYAAWARSLGGDGRLVAGDELATAGEELHGEGGPQPLNPGALESAPRGYFVIAAADQSEALRIARSCPHLKYGGRIVVRPIVSR